MKGIKAKKCVRKKMEVEKRSKSWRKGRKEGREKEERREGKIYLHERIRRSAGG